MSESKRRTLSMDFAVEIIELVEYLELLLEIGYYNVKTLLDKCTEVKRILISSINTAKQNT